MPYPIVPKKSLGIFSGLQEKFARDDERQRTLEERLQMDEMNALKKRTLEQSLAEGEEKLNLLRNPAPAKPNRTYDSSRGVIVDMDSQSATPLGLPEKPVQETPVNWQTQETDKGMVQVNPRTGETRPLNIRPPVKPDAGQKPPAPAEFEKKAAFMLEGAKTAAATLDGYSPTPRTWVNKVPGAGNYGLKESDQVALQAAETLHDAYLRLTTGATVTPDELRRAALQYVPSPGDGPQVLAKKRERRAQILRALESAASSVHRPGEVKAPSATPGVPSYEEWKAKRGGI